MATIETVPSNRRGRSCLPGRKDVPFLSYCIFCPPQDVNRRHDLVARTFIRCVHFKIDTCGRSEILARSMNRRRAAEAATILAHCFGLERARRLVQSAEV